MKIKNLPKKLAKSSGFTLTEILIVIFIIAIVAGATIPSFGTYNRRQNLKLQAKRLQTDIRTVQSRSVSGFKNTAVSATDAAAWGVHLENGLNSHKIFSCKSDEDPLNYKYGTCNNFYEETVTFASKVEVTGLSPENTVNIIFDVISGKVFFKRNDGNDMPVPGGAVIITLNYPGWSPEEVRRVRVTGGGNIEDYYGP